MVSDPHLSCVAVFGNGGGDTFMYASHAACIQIYEK